VNARPSLLFYCQHSLGMGHLVRSLAIAGALAERFRVVVLNGGRFPKGVTPPNGVEVLSLPPLGIDCDGKLVSLDRRRTVAGAQAARRLGILETFRAMRPDVLLVELFPFGRKKFAGELVPLLEEARAPGVARTTIVCSLRDILVGRPDDAQHDERAVSLANQYFDAILVHADPRFARLEESLLARTPLRVPVYYTGFVLPGSTCLAEAPMRRRQIVVSAGGGIVGEHLFRTAVEAHQLAWSTEHVPMKLVAGPFLPEAAWRSLREASSRIEGLSAQRYVRDLCAEMRASTASVSQCGYNTALDIVRAGIPALVVPFGTRSEDEQSKRAERLARLGVLRVLDSRDLTASRLAYEVRALAGFEPKLLGLDLGGARNAARIAANLISLGGRGLRVAR
jgi:predicted glycosyltransferase